MQDELEKRVEDLDPFAHKMGLYLEGVLTKVIEDKGPFFPGRLKQKDLRLIEATMKSRLNEIIADTFEKL